MELGQAVGMELLARMVVGFVAAVVGITLWAHTREASWILVVASVLLGYIEVLLRFLEALGLVSLDVWTWNGVPLIRTAFAAGVPLLLALGLWFALRGYRKP